MAKFLFNLGSFAARRAWLVLITWIVILVGVATVALTAGGTFTTTMSIPGTPAQKTIDELQATFSDASRGSGQVVFTTSDGAKFSTSQKAAIDDVLASIELQAPVDDTMNPFTTQQELIDRNQEILDGKIKLADAPAEIKDAQAKITQGRKDLKAAQKKITDGQKALDAGQVKLDAGLKKLKKSQAELDANRKTVNANLVQVRAGMAQVAGAIAQLTANNAPAEMVEPYTQQYQGLQANEAQLLAAIVKLDAGQTKLDAGLAKLTKGQADIDANQIKLDKGQVKIDSGYEKLADAQKKLDQAIADLPINSAKLAAGETLMKAAAGFRTVSKDGSTAIANVFFKKSADQLSTEDKMNVVNALTDAKIAGVQIEVSQSLTRTTPSVLGPGEIVGLAIAALVLFLMLGTFIGAGLPLISAIVGVGIAGAATLAFASVVEMGSTTPTLGVMLGLAVGIDYTLFILNRHRRQLKMGMDLRESIALANGTSGSAVLFAGLTVIIALAALNLTGIEFLGQMGTVGAAAIALSVVVAVTLTPALLSLLKMSVLNKREKAGIIATGEAERISVKPVLATKHPWLTLIGTTLLLAVIALPVTQMRLGLPDGSSEATDSTQYRAFSIITDKFGVGANGPLATVVTLKEKSVDEVAELEFQADVATRLMTLDNVDAVLPAGVSDDGLTMLFQVIPSGGPTSVETEQLVGDIRGLHTEFASSLQSDIAVTGLSAVNIDISEKLAAALPLYLTTVMLLSLLLLMLVFRSIAVPLIATVGFLLSVFAALGAVTAVFQWGWLGSVFDIHDPGPILCFLPTIVIGVLFGLAMDYQLFLVSGMREAFVHGRSAKDSVNYGIHLSRQVVVAAALIMVSVFGSFAFSHQSMIRPVGFGLAVGVLFDAFVIRLLFVPALMTILGKAAWWLPKWIDRVLPDVDVEGAKLEVERHH